MIRQVNLNLFFLTNSEFKQIYHQYGKTVRNYIYYRSGDEDIANDITQDTFIKLWKKKFQYDPDTIKGLLFKIASGLFLDYVRKEKFKAENIEHLKFQLKETINSAEDNEHYRLKCETALKVLTKKERTVFLMNRMESMIYMEIAEYLDISVKTVEKRMSNAIKKLKIK